MENLVIPQIAPTFYNGVKVLSSGQLAALLKCKRQNITDVYRNHKADFIEGVDYFYLEKDELYKFKVENGIFEAVARGGNTCPVFPNLAPVRPLSRTASSALVWTQSGALKQLTFFRTIRAKLILQSWLPNYFEDTPEKNILPAPNAADIDKLDYLKFLIERCTDENLRDDLIRMALNLLK